MSGSRKVARPMGAVRARDRGAVRTASDLLVLTKPRITALVLATTAAGYLAGSEGTMQLAGLWHALVGTALAAGGTNALNQVLERDVDARMARTRGRPLPARRLRAGPAAVFAVALALAGVAYLAFTVNALTAALAALTFVVYDFAYTPLKRVGSLSTLVGAVPGALPIVGGWTAATGRLEPGAWALFGILFLWQLPHFLALAWLYREDYVRAGLRMLTVEDPSGRQTGLQAVLYALALFPAALFPAVLGLAGGLYATGAVLLGAAFVVSAIRFARGVSHGTALGLFRMSLLYLPLLLGLLVFDGTDAAGVEAAEAREVGAMAAEVAPWSAGEAAATRLATVAGLEPAAAAAGLEPTAADDRPYPHVHGDCAGCVHDSQGRVMEGFMWGMALLSFTPLVLLAWIGGGLVLAHRREMRDEVERFLRAEAAHGSD